MHTRSLSGWQNLPVFAALVCAMALAAPAATTNYYYVSQVSPSPGSPFDSWANAAHDIQTAVDKAANDLVPGTTECTVLISNDIYTLTSQLTLTNGITLRSFNGDRTNTIINGGFPASTNRCLYITGNALVDGLTITNGFVNIQLAVPQSGSNWGAGVYMTAGTLQNCTLIGNSVTGTASRGAGVYMTGASVVSNCFITRNWSRGGACVGAGAYVGGGLLADCLVTTNNGVTATSGGVGGVYVINAVAQRCFVCDGNVARQAGGVSMGAGALVDACTISNNISSTGAGGAGVTLSGGILSNSLVVASRGTTYGAAILFNSAGIVQNCIIRSNTCRVVLQKPA
jgi:hypothetical protein